MPVLVSRKGAYSELKATTWLLEQGYDVFRNISPHGPVDIIAMKNGECILIDVKTSFISPNTGHLNHPQRTQEQIDLGVRILSVTPTAVIFSDEYQRPERTQTPATG